MLFDPLLQPPLLTADLPGIGGQIKQQPEDFEVEEIPAYEPCGQGDHLYLWLQKRGMGAEYFQRQIAHRLGIPRGEVGMAGLKDRHAVTRQMVSVPALAEPRLAELQGDGIEVLRVSRHTNKLRPGHLHGNRFRILVRSPVAGTEGHLEPILERLRNKGCPNYYGSQRFGRGGETVLLGLTLLRGESSHDGSGGQRSSRLNPFLRRLALSAAQSSLFNYYLALRLHDGLLDRVLPGDVMAKWPYGGMFVAQDVAQEQARFAAREIVHAGPMFRRKTFPAAAEAAEREQAVLQAAGLSADSFAGFGKLLQGTRRHNLIYLNDLTAAIEPDGVRLAFTLPSGSYATVVLREMTKNEPVDEEEASSLDHS